MISSLSRMGTPGHMIIHARKQAAVPISMGSKSHFLAPHSQI
jgi:hypothetical protein